MNHVVDSYLLQRQTYYFFFKRLFDLIVAGIAIVVASPLLAIIALCIKVFCGGSIIYRHKRMGYLGREVNVYKFRTMIQGADDYAKHFTPEQLKEFKETFKLKDDPRVTLFGKFLRKTSLDELPQLFNVLKGEMSIVGPRPVTREELGKYAGYVSALLSVKPGITGLWQVSGRNNIAYPERVEMDIQYVNNVTFLLDIKIILKTFIQVIRRVGVY